MKSCPKIVVLNLEALEPLRGLAVGRRFLMPRELQKNLEMAPPDVVALPTLLEALQGKLTDRFEHAEPFFTLPNEALLDERSDRVEIRVADLLGRNQREAAHEDGES